MSKSTTSSPAPDSDVQADDTTGKHKSTVDELIHEPPTIGSTRSTFSGVAVSVVLHVIVMGVLASFYDTLVEKPEEVVVDSIIDEERVTEEITQELEIETEVSENLNVVSGGVVSTQVGSVANQKSVATVNVETSEAIKDPELRVNAGPVTMPGTADAGMDLGEGEVTGEVGAVVSGYGPAMSRLTQELIRLMRQEKILVVWLFDQSDSMKDDQEEIAGKFHKVYEELGIASKQDKKLNSIRDEVLQTVIAAYGEKLSLITKEPTADVPAIQAAIQKIPIDESGKENLCAAISATVDMFARRTGRDDRKLVIIVVSDESGDDGQGVEVAIEKAKRIKSPVYILGRESVFGYPYARIRWKDPKYGLNHWLRINRGPETAYPEALQWDGLHNRWDAFSSGFGPYEQSRIVKETGGIFFVLPGEEEDLSGAGANEKRKFQALDMRRYRPMLLSRRDYADSRQRSPFRKGIFDVIARLNPNEAAVKSGLLPGHDPLLNIREHWYPLEKPAFLEEAVKQVAKARRSMELLAQAIAILEKIEPQRAREDFDRWRASFDLAVAQTRAYRVRLFQFLLAMDAHAANMPKPREKSNRWNVQRTRTMIEPDEQQFQRLKKEFNYPKGREEYLAYVAAETKAVTELYRNVIEEHPGTPWARRADFELRQGFGMRFVDVFRDPNYDKPDVKLPKP